jgi:DNA-binding XRE family transcriptional regulator
MGTKKWSEVRAEHVDAIGAERVVLGTSQVLARVRAHRLAEVRKQQGFTQRDVAEAMGVSVGRVSQIESGDLSGVDVLDRYVSAIGGQLEIMATFGDDHVRVG